MGQHHKLDEDAMFVSTGESCQVGVQTLRRVSTRGRASGWTTSSPAEKQQQHELQHRQSYHDISTCKAGRKPKTLDTKYGSRKHHAKGI